MTQYEILNFALTGINIGLNKELEVMERVERECGHKDKIAQARYDKLWTKYLEVAELMRAEEQKRA